jgi:hypothetical protein
MAQTDMPGIAGDDIPTLGQGNVQENEDQCIDQVVPLCEKRDESEN